MNQDETFMKNCLTFIFLLFSTSFFAQDFECKKKYDAENLAKEATFLGTKSNS